MILSSLLIRNFRLIEETSLTFSPGIQLVLGLNAQGKTSLLEAILFLSTSTSHRTRKEEELIRWGQDVAFIRGAIEKNGDSRLIECGLEKKRKIIKIDGMALPKVRDLYGHLRTVLFVPEDLAIVDGTPQERRRFLDMAMAQIDPSFISVLQQYKKILNQRNHLLKKIQEQRSSSLIQQLNVWDVGFVENAAKIIARRVETLNQLSPLLEQSYAALADDGPLHVSYSIGYAAQIEAITQALHEKLDRIRHTEFERGATQFGPHREDILFTLHGKNLALFGSQGQRRAAVLALRLAQAKLFYQFGLGSPLLLIDDVVYEMDNTRRERFWRYLDFAGQMIVTATDREHLGPGMQPNQVFKVDHGQIYLY